MLNDLLGPRAGAFSATDVFRDQTLLRTRKAAAAAAIAAAGTDVLVVPTVMHHYLVRELTEQEGAAPPVATYNAYLGTFTNFVNLLGMCALSVPAGRLPPLPQKVRAQTLCLLCIAKPSASAGVTSFVRRGLVQVMNPASIGPSTCRLLCGWTVARLVACLWTGVRGRAWQAMHEGTEACCHKL